MCYLLGCWCLSHEAQNSHSSAPAENRGPRMKSTVWTACPNTPLGCIHQGNSFAFFFSPKAKVRERHLEEACDGASAFSGGRWVIGSLGRTCLVNTSIWNFKSVLLPLSRWPPLEVWHSPKSLALPQHLKRKQVRRDSTKLHFKQREHQGLPQAGFGSPC